MKVRSQTLTALRALLDLCVYSAPQVPTSLSEIARRQQVSAAFLEQLFRRLKAAGLVAPWRGMRGGYTLTRSPKEISLLEIFQALQDPVVGDKISKQASSAPDARVETQVILGALTSAGQELNKALASLDLEELKRRALEHPDLKGVPRAGSGFSI
jgi:Rrf2 family iron-sulfur cluster assembly transcriptional regulator